MYVLIDCTNARAIATHKELGALGALAYIQYANVDTVTMPLNENRPFAQFDTLQLQHITESVLNDVDTVFKTSGFEYNDAIARCRAIIESAPHLRLPFSAAQLEAQAQKIAPEDDRPYAIRGTGETPERLTKWHIDPQRNRPRTAPGTTPQFTRSPPAPPRNVEAPTPEKPAKGAPKPPKPPGPPKPPKAPGSAPRAPVSKAPREERNGVKRPAAGGKCAAVWDIADSLYKGKAAPGLDAILAAAGDLNPGNVKTEYRQWVKFMGLGKK